MLSKEPRIVIHKPGPMNTEPRRARVNWHRDGLMGITYLDDGGSNVVDETEVDEVAPTFVDISQMSTEELRSHLEAIRVLRTQASKSFKAPKGPKAPKASKASGSLDFAALAKALSPETKAELMKMLLDAAGSTSSQQEDSKESDDE